MRVVLSGDLNQSLGRLADALDGDETRYSQPAPSLIMWTGVGVVTLAGSALAVPPVMGRPFLEGTVTSISSYSLTLSGFSIAGTALFDGVRQMPFTAEGFLAEDAFRSLLHGDLAIAGSDNADVVTPGGWANLAGDDSIVTGRGDDRVAAGMGRDRIEGGAGQDRLSGDKGCDRIRGGDGHDRIAGGRDRDELTGGSGRDVFVFSEGDGRDLVTDFDVRLDRIDLDRGAEALVRDTRLGALVEFDGGSVLLRGVDAADVPSELFV